MKELNKQELKAIDLLLEQAAVSLLVAKKFRDLAAQEYAAETLRAANAVKGLA